MKPPPLPEAIRGFTKTGNPKIDPQIVGFRYHKDPKRHPLISETPNKAERGASPACVVGDGLYVRDGLGQHRDLVRWFARTRNPKFTDLLGSLLSQIARRPEILSLNEGGRGMMRSHQAKACTKQTTRCFRSCEKRNLRNKTTLPMHRTLYSDSTPDMLNPVTLPASTLTRSQELRKGTVNMLCAFFGAMWSSATQRSRVDLGNRGPGVCLGLCGLTNSIKP